MGTPDLSSYVLVLRFVPLATVVVIVFGVMLLPRDAGFDLPIFAALGNHQHLYIGVLAGALTRSRIHAPTRLSDPMCPIRGAGS